MRDFALLCLLLALCWLAFLRPWLGVLGLAVIGYFQPHGYAVGFMRFAPVFSTVFGVVVFSYLYHAWKEKAWKNFPWERLLGWQVIILGLLWLWFGVTSHFSVMPISAWEKYLTVLKILPPLLLTLLLIDSREKLLYLVVIIALCILLPAIKGGYWALASGFQDRVYGPPGSPHYGNNEFAIAVTMAIPLLVLWYREVRDRRLQWTLIGSIVFCYGAVISSWSRGAMLSLGAVTLLLLWNSRRKVLAIPGLVLLGALLFMQLPENWFGRMETIVSHEADASAQNRLAVWRVGMNYVEQRPAMGGGFSLWPALTLESGGIDWHSSYVKLAAEHGIIGLAIWLSLFLGTVLSLGRLTWQHRKAEDRWLGDYAAMLQASLVAYLVGGITLGIPYWELPYHLVVIASLLTWIACHGNPERAFALHVRK